MFAIFLHCNTHFYEYFLYFLGNISLSPRFELIGSQRAHFLNLNMYFNPYPLLCPAHLREAVIPQTFLECLWVLESGLGVGAPT